MTTEDTIARFEAELAKLGDPKSLDDYHARRAEELRSYIATLRLFQRKA